VHEPCYGFVKTVKFCVTNLELAFMNNGICSVFFQNGANGLTWWTVH